MMWYDELVGVKEKQGKGGNIKDKKRIRGQT